MIEDMFRYGGVITYCLIFLGSAVIAIFIERFLSLRKEQKILKYVFPKIIDYLNCNEYQKALDEVEKNEGVVPYIFFDVINKNTKQKTKLKECLEETAASEIPKLWKNLNLISVIITVAPLLGLLGTVIGMFNAFNEIELLSQNNNGSYGPSVIAAGIKQALLTTILGLVVAVPAQFLYHFLTSKIENISIELEKCSYEIIDKVSELAK